MGKFYKQGKIVVVLKGKHAGKKGIIIKTIYENTKERKYPHCVVAGLARGPKKATKKNLKKIEEKVQELEKKGNATERIAKLRSLGVFIKTYNMAHLLVTRYSVKDSFGTTEELAKLDELETQLKDSKNELAKLQHDKKEENAKQIEALQSKIGKQKDDYQNAFTKSKANIGSKMYTRFMEGFPMTGNAEDKERQFHTQFLFKKLKF